MMPPSVPFGCAAVRPEDAARAAETAERLYGMRRIVEAVSVYRRLAEVPSWRHRALARQADLLGHVGCWHEAESLAAEVIAETAPGSPWHAACRLVLARQLFRRVVPDLGRRVRAACGVDAGVEDARLRALAAIAEAIDAGDDDAALAAYRVVPERLFMLSGTFTTQYMVRFLARRGRPVERVEGSDPRAVAVPDIFFHGRFAHTLYRMIALVGYTDAFGLPGETPDWPGHYAFELDTPVIGDRPKARYEDQDLIRAMFAGGLPGPGARALPGTSFYYPYIDSWNRGDRRERLQDLFRLRPFWRELFAPDLERLAEAGRSLIVVHARRFDRSADWNLDFDVYRGWVRTVADHLPDPVVYLASDEPEFLRDAFPGIPCLSAGDMPSQWPFIDHLRDFHILMNADAVAFSLGTFAKLACAFNRRGRFFAGPAPGGAGLQPYDPWPTV